MQEGTHLGEPFRCHEEHRLTEISYSFALHKARMAIRSAINDCPVTVEEPPDLRAKGSIAAVHVPGQDEARERRAPLPTRAANGGCALTHIVVPNWAQRKPPHIF